MATATHTEPRRAETLAGNINAGAPRLPHHDNFAAAAQRLTWFKVNGATPFGPSPHDATGTLLEQASALTVLLSSAYEDCDQNSYIKEVGENLRDLRWTFLAQSLAGINSLIALAAFMREGEREQGE